MASFVASFILKCVFKKLLIGKIKTGKDKMNRKNQQLFFSKEQLHVYF